MGGLGGGALLKKRNPEPGTPSGYGNNLGTPSRRAARGGGGDDGHSIWGRVGVAAAVAKERAVPALPARLSPAAGPWKPFSPPTSEAFY